MKWPEESQQVRLALSADGRTLYVTHTSSGRLTVVDTETLAVRRVIATTADVTLAGAAVLDEAADRAYVPATRANSVSTALVFDSRCRTPAPSRPVPNDKAHQSGGNRCGHLTKKPSSHTTSASKSSGSKAPGT